MSDFSRCEKIAFLISQSLDRKLSLWESLKLRWHCMMCKGCRDCRRAQGTIQQLLKIYRGDMDATIEKCTVGMSEEARTAIKRALKEKLNKKEK